MSDDPPSEPSTNQYDHQKLINEYKQLIANYADILNERDSGFLEEKHLIEERYHNQFLQLDDYERKKRNFIELQGKFHQQIIDDKKEFQKVFSDQIEN